MCRANSEVAEGYFGSAQWYWLHKLEGVGGFDDNNPIKVMRWGWDCHKNIEWPSTNFCDYHGVVLPVDHRLIGKNEIVFDIDQKKPWKSWGKVYEANVKMSEGLEKLEIPHYIYQSGGKGFHIHIYVKGYRGHAIEWILKRLKMSKYAGVGKPIDGHLLTGSHMVRMEGGRKHNSKDIVHYKSYIPSIKYKLKPVTNFRDVRFPDELEVWNGKKL